MRISFTADNHLTGKQDHTHRFQTLISLLKACGEEECDLLIFAGDLFDKIQPNYSEFEKIVQEHRPRKTGLILIPGNHDPDLSQKHFSVQGIKVYQQPAALPLENNWWMLLVPYRDSVSMGEEIAPFSEKLQGKRWILVSHGDYTQGVRDSNPYEKGTYLPLTGGDLQRYQPHHVFLGHIHRPHQRNIVFYPGSPCPLDRTETGLRRFLIFDTETNQIESKRVNSPIIYFDENFLLLPGQDQLGKLRSDLNERKNSWDLPPSWKAKANIQVRVRGIADDRAAVKSIFESGLSSYKFSPDQNLDLNQLYHQVNPDLAFLSSEFFSWIQARAEADNLELFDRQDILYEALKIIHGVE